MLQCRFQGSKIFETVVSDHIVCVNIRLMNISQTLATTYGKHTEIVNPSQVMSRVLWCVCLSVCLLTCISQKLHIQTTPFCTCCLWSRLLPSLSALWHVTCILWMTLCYVFLQWALWLHDGIAAASLHCCTQAIIPLLSCVLSSRTVSTKTKWVFSCRRYWGGVWIFYCQDSHTSLTVTQPTVSMHQKSVASWLYTIK